MKFTSIAFLAASAFAASIGQIKEDPVALTANGKPLKVLRIGNTNVWWAQAKDTEAEPDKVWYVQNGELSVITEKGGQHAVVRDAGGVVLFSQKQNATLGFKIQDNTISFNNRLDWYLCTKGKRTFLEIYGPDNKLPTRYTCVPAQLQIV